MAAPADLTFTPTDPGSPDGLLAWTHAGPEDRFQVLYKLEDADSWVSYLIALKSFFGSGPYSIEVVSPSGAQWTVAALTAAGVRSG